MAAPAPSPGCRRPGGLVAADHRGGRQAISSARRRRRTVIARRQHPAFLRRDLAGLSKGSTDLIRRARCCHAGLLALESSPRLVSSPGPAGHLGGSGRGCSLVSEARGGQQINDQRCTGALLGWICARQKRTLSAALYQRLTGHESRQQRAGGPQHLLQPVPASGGTTSGLAPSQPTRIIRRSGCLPAPRQCSCCAQPLLSGTARGSQPTRAMLCRGHNDLVRWVGGGALHAVAGGPEPRLQCWCPQLPYHVRPGPPRCRCSRPWSQGPGTAPAHPVPCPHPAVWCLPGREGSGA